MKEKFEDFLYNVFDFLMNNKWAFALFYLILASSVSFFILYPINKAIASGFMGGAVITLIYNFSKSKDNE